MTTPSIEFFENVPEELLNVSLRTNQKTGAHNVLMLFGELKAVRLNTSLAGRKSSNLRLVDEEGVITVDLSSFKFYFGGEEGDEQKKAECSFEIDVPEHWERFMRFMHRYAEANGLGYGESAKS